MTDSKLLFECGICMDNKEVDNITFLPCIHFICTTCYDKLTTNLCPFCRNVISEEKEEDSFDEAENEYHDVQFEILVLEEDRRARKRDKKNRKKEKKIMKLLENNSEVVMSGSGNSFTILRNVLTQ